MEAQTDHEGGQRAGPRVRTDIVEVYVARRGGVGGGLEILQLRRAEEPMRGSWQPVIGHVERGETATACALREAREELGLDVHAEHVVGAWALQGVHPYFIASSDEVVMSPRFLIEVTGAWKPVLNHEHDAWRWVPEGRVRDDFVWPGQHAALSEAAGVLRGGSGATRVREA